MRLEDLANLLSDMVRAEPDESRQQREELAEYLYTLAQRVTRLEKMLEDRNA